MTWSIFSVSVLPVCIATTVKAVCSLFEKASCTWHDDELKLVINLFMTPCKEEMSTCKMQELSCSLLHGGMGILYLTSVFPPQYHDYSIDDVLHQYPVQEFFFPLPFPLSAYLYAVKCKFILRKLSDYLLKPNETTDMMNRCEAGSAIFNKSFFGISNNNNNKV